jgi:hypothetical protein
MFPGRKYEYTLSRSSGGRSGKRNGTVGFLVHVVPSKDSLGAIVLGCDVVSGVVSKSVVFVSQCNGYFVVLK